MRHLNHFHKTLVSLSALILFFGLQISAAFAEREEPYDPIESVNRGIFWFNDQLDQYILEPVARQYDWLMPGWAQRGVTSFFNNLRYPSHLVSDLVQGKLDQAGVHTGRFLINSTIGVLGIIDVADDFGLKKHEEDFGIALAYRGVPAGPYLVLPFLGPSNMRDGVGLAVDTVLDPITWVSWSSLPRGTRFAITASARGLKVIQTRAGLLQAIDSAKESSLDYYLFAQSAYYQYRYGLLTDGKEDEDADMFDDQKTPEPETKDRSMLDSNVNLPG